MQKRIKSNQRELDILFLNGFDISTQPPNSYKATYSDTKIPKELTIELTYCNCNELELWIKVGAIERSNINLGNRTNHFYHIGTQYES